jgi:two-component system, OmpR family, phosphate regulon sensor histidine kinase PhoR
LKTPIFNIQGYIETLAEGGIYDENINMAYIKRAEKNVTRMITIIDDLDAITQLEGGHLVLDIEQFDIRILAKEVIESLELTAKKKNIELRFNREYINPVYVYADKHRIRQVLVNLLTNSIKYSLENGNTEISFIKIKDQVEVFVRDTGIGISPEHLPRLFERFYRIDKGRSREQGGTGLGLAIVKHIIEAHDSTINVSSKVGVGTSFRFLLKGDMV